MRLFVASSIPTEVRENIALLIRELRGVDPNPKWINQDNLHVTLKFIGEVGPEKVMGIGDALAAVHAQQQVIAEFRDVGFFPDARRPSVAWVGIQPPQMLSSLAAEVNRVLAPLGIRREEKPFVPHLTIARFRETQLSPPFRGEIQKQTCPKF